MTMEAGMDVGVILIWIGACLVIAGVLFTAAKALNRGRLSEARPSQATPSTDTLEPRGQSARLSLSGSAPGLALAGAGALLLLVGAMI
jgi:hypothetical protein